MPSRGSTKRRQNADYYRKLKAGQVRSQQQQELKSLPIITSEELKSLQDQLVQEHELKTLAITQLEELKSSSELKYNELKRQLEELKSLPKSLSPRTPPSEPSPPPVIQLGPPTGRVPTIVNQIEQQGLPPRYGWRTSKRLLRYYSNGTEVTKKFPNYADAIAFAHDHPNGWQ